MSVTNNLKVTAGDGAGKVSFSNTERFSLIAGPCQMESREHAFMIAGVLKSFATSWGSGSFISRPSTRRTAPRFPANAASASRAPCRSSPISRRNSAFLF